MFCVFSGYSYRQAQKLSGRISPLFPPYFVSDKFRPVDAVQLLGLTPPSPKRKSPDLGFENEKTGSLQKFFTNISHVWHVTASTLTTGMLWQILLNRSPDALFSRGGPFCILWLSDVIFGVFTKIARESRYRSVIYFKPL